MSNNRLKIRQVEDAHSLPAASRASWIGTLKTCDLAIPVKAYSTIATAETNLHLIHAACGRRISLRKVCPEHGVLESDDLKKAFAYSSDMLVELSEDELASLEPVDERTIEIERFFSPDRLDLTLLSGRTLCLAPASLAAQDAFHVLKTAFDDKNTWALGRTVFSRKRHLVVLHSREDALLLHTLHDPALRRMPVYSKPNGNAPTRNEVRKLARAMDDCGAPIPWNQYRDDSPHRLAALVAGKVNKRRSNRKDKSSQSSTKASKRQRRTRTTAKAA